ncbi:MAG: shufflon system plasmid conjugative transfer pilus tip adhesin PilV [Bacteroidota bacterium]
MLLSKCCFFFLTLFTSFNAFSQLPSSTINFLSYNSVVGPRYLLSFGRVTTGLTINASSVYLGNDRWTGSGLGLGTTSPAYKLHTKGDIFADGGWLRVSGNNGLYFEKHGGGFYMQDKTWIRTSHQKSFYHETGIMRTDGDFQVGSNGDRFLVDGSGHVRLSGNLKRRAHHTGHLEGSYNNIGENSTRTNPIYTIGSSYNPSDAALSNMYGVGYTHSNSSFINATDLGITPPSDWGFYVAANGSSKIFLGGNTGNGYFKGNVYSSGGLVSKSVTTIGGNLSLTGGGWGMDYHIDTDNNSTNAFTWYGNGAEQMKLTDDGKLGIGTAPLEKLDVEGNVRWGTVGSSGWGDGILTTASGWADGAYPTIGSAGSKGSLIMLHNPHIPFRTDNAANSDYVGRAGLRMAVNEGATDWWDMGLAGDFFHIFKRSSGEFLRVTGEGKVGIGTKTPAEMLDVNGNIAADNLYLNGGITTGGSLQVDAISVNGDITAAGTITSNSIHTTGPIDVSAGGLTLADQSGMLSFSPDAQNTAIRWSGTGESGRLSFNHGTASTREIMTLMPNGTVGIGTSTPSPSHNLHVAGTILADGMTVENSFTVNQLILSNAPNPDPQASQILARDTDGQIVYHELEDIRNPWGIRFIENAAGTDQNCLDFTDLQDLVLEVDVLDLHGNLLLGNNGYIDDRDAELTPEESIYAGPTPSSNDRDDWIKLSGRVEVSSSDADEGLVVFGKHATSSQYVNITQDGPYSVFANSRGKDDYFMRTSEDATANPLIEFRGEITSSGNITTTDYLSAVEWKEAHTRTTHLGDGIQWTGSDLAMDIDTEYLEFESGKLTVKTEAVSPWTQTDGDLTYGGGKIGVGTETPDHALTVNGLVHAKEVLIDLEVPGPDYVFEADYDLRSLEEIETYVKKEKHLPEVPPAAEMEANGVEVGEMNMLLLKKVEELTLHLIEQNKQLKAQNERVEAQNERIATLEAALANKKK